MLDNPPLKFISINIEKHRHIGRVLDFFGKENPDVVCFQEILEEDFLVFLETLGFFGQFVPMARYLPKYTSSEEPVVSGIAIISKFPLKIETLYYYGSPSLVPDFIRGEANTYNRMVLVGKFSLNGKKFNIGSTHFTWTYDGNIDDWQRKDLANLMEQLEKYPEIIFCGDLNAPRGREVFDTLASKYKDNIPAHLTTSIDKNLHRAGDLQLMVDALFTTPGYEARNVRLQNGVSDHMAVVAELF